MRYHHCLVTSLLLVSGALAAGDAEEVRYYVQDGITYRETRRTIQRPIVETRLQQSTQTVLREELATEYRDTLRTWWMPVTEYRCETHWVGRWNPFVQPYLENRWVPQSRWEKRTESVKIPVTCRRLVPETRTVQLPVATQRMVSEDVITRVAVGPAPPNLSENPASAPQNPGVGPPKPIGGIARLDSDPPRHPSDGGCRASVMR